MDCVVDYRSQTPRGGTPGPWRNQALRGWFRMSSLPHRGCSVEDCTNKHHSKGFCSKHLSRMQRRGTTEQNKVVRLCSVEGCKNLHRSGGLCLKHDQRMRRHGSMAEPATGPSFPERFWAKVNKNGPVHCELKTPCWLWTAYTGAAGYGRFGRQNAHRVSFLLTHGALTPGLEIDHICRVRNCVNPEHLQELTHQANVDRCLRVKNAESRDKYKTSKTSPKGHCPRGHAYDLVRKDGVRICRVCKNETNRLYRQRKAAK